MKGLSPVISAALIFAIALALTATAYIWGSPLIQKRQEASVTEKIYNQFSPTNQNSLPRIIEYVAKNKGMKSFTASTEGLWVLNEDENSVEFTFTSKTSNIATNTEYPISLTTGTQCTESGGLPSPPDGILGQDSPAVVCAKAVTEGDFFTIKYKIWFRELNDNPFAPTQGSKIDLSRDPSGSTTSSGKTVKIIFDESTQETTQQTTGPKTLIIKKIKILFI